MRILAKIALSLGLLVSAPAALAQPLTAAERGLVVQALGGTGEARTRLEALGDEALQARVLDHARTELGQRIRPKEVDSQWGLAPPVRDVASEFRRARETGTLGAWLRALPPTDEAYRGLLAARRRYEAFAARGGWPALAAGPVLRPGQTHPQAAELRARLAAEDYATGAGAQAELFDPALEQALRAFQARHGLAADAALGPATRAALNVTAQERLAQIDANLERARWLPRPLPADRIEVEAGSATLRLFRGDRPALEMKVVVGDPEHRTPMFASAVEAVVFNPPWNVPASIASKEILPRAARDPSYLARQGFVVRDGGGLQQRPGPLNALGVVKFDFPSPYGVYLHDTPGKSAFLRERRALSHGCMRLEKPLELAAALLSAQGFSREDVEAAVAARATRRIALRAPTPLYVQYRTVAADAAGGASLWPDIYGWDRKLAEALASTPVTRVAASQAATDCTERP